MAKQPVVKLTAHFARRLEDIEHFLIEADAPTAFDGLLDELLDVAIPNLQRFPRMGRPFLHQQVRSVEAASAVGALTKQLAALSIDPDTLREYVLKHYLLLYAVADDAIYLLSIRHHRQLSFDFEGHWN